MQENGPGSTLPYFEGERRKEDRRQNDRQGKYDRRKNRCVHCLYFQPGEASGGLGHCARHHTDIAAETFACPQFSAAGLQP
jgi:hypothetical protein